MLKELAASMLFPSEITAMLKLKFGGYVQPCPSESLDVLATTLSDIDFCYTALNKVSRSFAVVIQQLPQQLKDPVCIFYLVLRGLDSVEDDMTYDNALKLPLLHEFHLKLADTNWSISGVGDSADYRILLAHFDKVLRVYHQLSEDYQRVIAEITRRMGAGMAEYATKTTSIDSVNSYNLYCHYVAGLVGYGLSRLFSASKLEDTELQFEERISNSMGLFLQKTNIIRDYLEDLEAGRTWWPQEIWGLYSNSLDSFARDPHSPSSLACLNHLVADALSHVPDVLDYLSRLHDQKIFEFCAIPQVMAIATLAEVYQNRKVFKGVVKIRKGLSCKLMIGSSTMEQVTNYFMAFIQQIQHKIPALSRDEEHRVLDNSTDRVKELVKEIKILCKQAAGTSQLGSPPILAMPTGSIAHPTVTNSLKVQHRKPSQNGTLPTATASTDSPADSPTNMSRSKMLSGSPSRGIPVTLIRMCNAFACLLFICASMYILYRLRFGGSSGIGSASVNQLLSENASYGPGSWLMRPSTDLLASLTCFVSVGYLFGFFGIQYVN